MKPIFDKSLLIATFCNHRPGAGYHDSMVRLAFSLREFLPDVNVETIRLGDATLVWEARNRIAHAALAKKHDFLLFIDSDIIFTPEDVKNLIFNSLDVVHPKPVLRSGIYADRRYWVPIARLHEQEKIGKIAALQKIFLKMRRRVTMFPVLGLPMGFTLIQTSIFKEMGPPWFFEDYQQGTLNRVGEDYYFCQKAFKMGVEPILDCSVWVGHEGHTVIDPKQLMQQYEQYGDDFVTQLGQRIEEAGF